MDIPLFKIGLNKKLVRIMLCQADLIPSVPTCDYFLWGWTLRISSTNTFWFTLATKGGSK